MIDAVEEYYRNSGQIGKQDVLDIVAIFQELYEYTEDEDFRREIDRICRVYDVCPHCMQDYLTDRVVGREHIERNIDVPQTERVCRNCGAAF